MQLNQDVSPHGVINQINKTCTTSVFLMFRVSLGSILRRVYDLCYKL